MHDTLFSFDISDSLLNFLVLAALRAPLDTYSILFIMIFDSG